VGKHGMPQGQASRTNYSKSLAVLVACIATKSAASCPSWVKGRLQAVIEPCPLYFSNQYREFATTCLLRSGGRHWETMAYFAAV